MLRQDSPATKRRLKSSRSLSTTRPGPGDSSTSSVAMKMASSISWGDQQHLFAGLMPQFQQQRLHLLAGKGVKRAEGLVQQQQLRIRRQRRAMPTRWR
ncbi:Uncharacterised protein [Klebsiella pneumoniae]|nr:Uncharacterised protein [Klebsiella pneumoniae]